MVDTNTHVIQYMGYWFLVREKDGEWLDEYLDPVCKVNEEEKILKLKDIL